jgi:hypothetical protein
MIEAQKKELDEQKDQAGDGEEESGVTEVRDADGRLGRRSAFGVGKEERLVFGGDGRTEDWNGDGGFF